MQYFLNWFTRLYPVWLVGTALLAFFFPPSMLWFSGQWIVWALSVSMLGMGLTLSPTDFQGILKMPGSSRDAPLRKTALLIVELTISICDQTAHSTQIF